jgi:spore coat protein CotH
MDRRVWAVPAAVLAGLLIVAGADGLSQPPGGMKAFGSGFGKEKRKLVERFDKNGDGWVDREERAAAREFLKADGRGGKFGFGGPKGFGKGGEPGRPGPKVSPADVKTYPGSSLYEPAVLRTVFLQFENADWEQELQDFHDTDVEVPATLTVDGKTFRNVGVHFRGMSSYLGVGPGSKRSLNVSLDLADKKQRLSGYKTLNLLNSHDDPGMMSTVLYSHVARRYVPTPKANFVKVVINGESWGVYVSAQQFDKVFLKENFKTDKGTRWKVRGSPGGRGGLEYVGDRVEDYKRIFEIKGEDNETAWRALIKLCKTLNETPPDKLEAALAPMLDVDGVLAFLALDVALINNDGYWVRASDYSLYLDPKGKFHLIPHDMNEAFRGAGGPGGLGGFRVVMPRPGEVMPPFLQDGLNLTLRQKEQVAALQKEVDEKLDRLLTEEQRAQLRRMREGGPMGGPPGFGPPGGPPGFGPPGGPGGMGPRGGGVELDPLVGLDNPRTPLRGKLLAVPALRERYLAKVRAIAEESLDWKKLGPVVAQYRTLIEEEVRADTRKLDSLADFQRLTADDPGEARGRGTTLRQFADQRRKFLLDHPEVKKLPR